jgi:hypothetical protein
MCQRSKHKILRDAAVLDHFLEFQYRFGSLAGFQECLAPHVEWRSTGGKMTRP